MLQKANEALEKYAIGKKIAVAVSGGEDSMCLMHLVLNCPFIQKKDVLVVNVEHGIRGESSVRDSEFVRRQCEKYGVALHCVDGNVPLRCQESGNSLETEARLLRKEVFADLLAKQRVQLVLTAHHRSDNAETVLMHMLRGCGLNGLKGMPVLSKEGILRPLICESKAQISEYNAAHGVEFVNDETNSDVAYTRNFVRCKVMPLLNERFSAESALCNLSEHAQRDDDYIMARINKKRLKKSKDGDCVSLPTALLSEKHSAIACRYALLMLSALGIDDYDADAITGIIKAAALNNGGKVSVCKGVWAAKEYEMVSLYRQSEKIDAIYEFSEGKFLFGKAVASVKGCSTRAADLIVSDVSAYLPLGNFMIDAAKVPMGAVLRTRKDGDIFTPYGGGRRKLKEYLIEKKIPLRLRDKLPLLCYNNTILAIFGLEISEHVKLDERTVYVLDLRLENFEF